jgi:hypothetical protein
VTPDERTLAEAYAAVVRGERAKRAYGEEIEPREQEGLRCANRFVIKSEMNQRLFREAKRGHMAAADLLREFIDQGSTAGVYKSASRARPPRRPAARRLAPVLRGQRRGRDSRS